MWQVNEGKAPIISTLGKDKKENFNKKLLAIAVHHPSVTITRLCEYIKVIIKGNKKHDKEFDGTHKKYVI